MHFQCSSEMKAQWFEAIFTEAWILCLCGDLCAVNSSCSSFWHEKRFSWENLARHRTVSVTGNLGHWIGYVFYEVVEHLVKHVASDLGRFYEQRHVDVEYWHIKSVNLKIPACMYRLVVWSLVRVYQMSPPRPDPNWSFGIAPPPILTYCRANPERSTELLALQQFLWLQRKKRKLRSLSAKRYAVGNNYCLVIE